MLVQYYCANGAEISYQCSMDVPTMNDVDHIAMMYAERCPNRLPDTIYCSVRIYGTFINSFCSMGMAQTVQDGKVELLQIHTSVGPLVVKPMPMCYDAKQFLIGRQDDWDRYDVDKIFEDVVLKDCERV